MRILIVILAIGLSGCSFFFDQFDGGYRYCKKDDVYWHKQWGETHNCKEGKVLRRDGVIFTRDEFGFRR